MPKHNFSAILAHYRETIRDMPDTFTSHQFILRLAHKHQGLYVGALYAYRDATHRGTSAPFLVVHAILAKRLHKHPKLIELIRRDAPSTDIFGQSNQCAEWRKLK